MSVIRKARLLYRSLLIAFACAGATNAYCQEVVVQGGFLGDSLKIGEEIPFYLSARYNASHTVLFPDSTADFSPFEYVRKTYYPTRTAGGISIDSTVYYLTTFEIDRVQTLTLPVYLIHGPDSLIFSSPRDTVRIIQLVAQVPDTVSIQELPLREQTAYEEVDYAFNFWMMFIIATVLAALALIVWMLFGERIRQYIKTRRLQKRHSGFLEAYNQLLHELEKSASIPLTESALATWKRYMEQLESRPYTKLTTRETAVFVADPTLTEHLSQVDRAIYGHAGGVVASLEMLKAYANKRFEHKLKEVQHG